MSHDDIDPLAAFMAAGNNAETSPEGAPDGDGECVEAGSALASAPGPALTIDPLMCDCGHHRDEHVHAGPCSRRYDCVHGTCTCRDFVPKGYPATLSQTINRLPAAGAGSEDDPGLDTPLTVAAAPAVRIPEERTEISSHVGETDADILRHIADWLDTDPSRVLIGLWSTGFGSPLEIDLQVITTVMPEGGE